uniref:Uncharacterized protein n=1 Tax=Anguilla anguilla TaxID=7936 RepID=A0A0E9SW42_ANGAN
MTFPYCPDPPDCFL